MPSASSASTFVEPLIAGKTASCRFGITNESITENRAPEIPEATAACTAATSPRTITMYFPEQIERDSTTSTSAAFNIASHERNPDAMLVNSIKPIEFFAISPSNQDALCRNLDVFRRHRAHLAVDTRMHICAQLAFLHASDELPLPHSFTFLDRRVRRLACVLLQLDPHHRRLRRARFERCLALILLHLQTAAQLRERYAAIFLHRVHFHRRLLHEFQPRRTAVLLALVARFFGIQILGTSVKRTQPARAAQFGPLIPDVAA